jgi:hypothetical protein
MRFLRGVFFDNLGLKAGALVISLALWTAYSSEPVVETGYSAPLLLVNVPAGMEVQGEVPATVLLRVRGRLARLRRLAPGELSVSADCSQASAGSRVMKLAPDVGGAPYGTEIVGVTPSEIRISFVPASAPSSQRN